MGESSTVLRSKELSRHQCVGEGVAGSKPDNTNPGLRPKRAVPAVRVQSGLGGARCYTHEITIILRITLLFTQQNNSKFVAENNRIVSTASQYFYVICLNNLPTMFEFSLDH